MPDAIYDDDLIERIRAWALKVETFTPAVGHEYVEGFGDAQTVVLGLIQAGTEPDTCGLDACKVGGGCQARESCRESGDSR